MPNDEEWKTDGDVPCCQRCGDTYILRVGCDFLRTNPMNAKPTLGPDNAFCPNDTDMDGNCHLCAKDGGCPNDAHAAACRLTKREAAIHADVFNPAESDLQYLQRRRRELGLKS